MTECGWRRRWWWQRRLYDYEYDYDWADEDEDEDENDGNDDEDREKVYGKILLSALLCSKNMGFGTNLWFSHFHQKHSTVHKTYNLKTKHNTYIKYVSWNWNHTVLCPDMLFSQPKRHTYSFIHIICEALYTYTYSVRACAVCHHSVLAVVGKKELTYFIYQSYHDELIRST